MINSTGEKFLVFSASIKILDILSTILDTKGIRLLRMDGSYKSMEREEVVRKFQNEAKYKAFLLTTGVGSVGLTLTAATNVIIFDPDWNPGKDDQEMVRNFRKIIVLRMLIQHNTYYIFFFSSSI